MALQALRSRAQHPPGRVESGEADILRNVAVRFPGVRLVSAVQGLVYLQQFREGIRHFESLPEPTAADKRWVGVCHFQLFEDAKAFAAFSSAVSAGEEAARINLAHLLRFLERGEEATGELRSVRLEQLNEYDRVFYYRVVSVDEENNGNLREALKAAEEAWKRIQGLPEYNLLAPSILSQLGVLHSRIGRAQRALWFLERSIQMTKEVDNLKARLRRSAVLNLLGRHREATTELDALVAEGLPDNFIPELHINRAEVAWSAGNLELAASEFHQCINSSERVQAAYEELVARLSLAAIACVREDFETGAQHLSRAQELISDKSDRLSFRFREVHLNYARGKYSTSHATSELTALDHEFGEMGLLQEQAFVKLHRAALRQSDSQRAMHHLLEEVVSLTMTLQNRAFLAREWTVLPGLRRSARNTHPALIGDTEAILELRTLGEERIILAGSDVRLPLRRAVELLAYFLEHKAAAFEQVRTDLFPEEKHRTAKSYFHQFRHQLKEHVEGLEIEYEAESRMYRLKSEIDILWDVADLRAGRRSEAPGAFLPTCTSDWALTLDHALERFRTSH